MFANVDSLLFYNTCAAIVGVILNSLTIAVLATGTKVGRGIKVQLISLASADILSGIFFVLAQHYVSTPSQSLGVYGCRTIIFIGYGCLYASLCCNAAISLERLVIVFFPLKALQYSKRKKLVVTASAWILGLASELEVIFDRGVVTVSRKNVIDNTIFPAVSNMRCKFSPPAWVGNSKHRKALYYWLMVIRYVVPFCIIVTCYTLIGLRIWRKAAIGEQAASEDHLGESARKNKVLRMLAIDAGVTISTWLPSALIASLSMTDSLPAMSRELRLNLELASMGILTSNVFTSPVIYFIANQAFREDAMSMLASLLSLCKGSLPCQKSQSQSTVRNRASHATTNSSLRHANISLISVSAGGSSVTDNLTVDDSLRTDSL